MLGHTPDEREIEEIIATSDNILARMREATDADRKRDEGEDMMVGYGYDFRDESEKIADFKATR